MKKKFFGILFALVLALSLSLIPAVPVGADANKTVTPPNIDGIIASGEWDTAQIEFDTGPLTLTRPVDLIHAIKP